MFIIIGGDGKEYGPVTADQIRAWIAAGRASLDTQAKAVGGEEWRRLGDFAEFSAPETLPPVVGQRAATDWSHTIASAPAAHLAGYGSRIGAALFNAFFYFLCMLPGISAMNRKLMLDNPQLAEGGFPRFDTLNLEASRDSGIILLVQGGLLAGILLQCILLAWRSQNLGKLMTRARVVRADGARANFFRAGFLRFLLPVAVFLTLNYVPPLGLLFLFVDFCFIFRADRRCLHDLIAGTKVVRA